MSTNKVFTITATIYKCINFINCTVKHSYCIALTFHIKNQVFAHYSQPNQTNICFLFHNILKLLSFYSGITFPYTPYNILISWLSIVGKESSSQSTTRPCKLNPLTWLHTFEYAIQQSPHKSIASTNAVHNIYCAQGSFVPCIIFIYNSTLQMFVSTNNFTQCVSKNRNIWESPLCIKNHPFKCTNCILNILTTCFRSFYSKTKLIILFVTYKNI